MTPNRKRGLKRLAIAVAVPWFGWWGLIGITSYNSWRYFNGRVNAAAVLGQPFPVIDSELENGAMRRMSLAIFWGGIVPILLLIAAGVGYWVYRGFKPKEKR